MSTPYPRIRLTAQNGQLLLREGLSICFYMHRSHHEVGQAVLSSLETYLHEVGPQALTWYADAQGEMQELDEQGWGYVRSELLRERNTSLYLKDGPGGVGEFQFEYHGRSLEDPERAIPDESACAVSFWLSTEYLETHGPEHVRELALELARPLPFNSGHAGLSFNALMDLVGVSREIRRRCFRYPGLDILELSSLSRQLGTRVRGADWLTFLGHPVLGNLGGVSGLRDRLKAPAISVQSLDAERALVALGRAPEAGDTEQGRDLSLHRELARVLEPWLHQDSIPLRDFTEEETRRWERRFLD